MSEQSEQNTDTRLWSENPDDPYSPHVLVTAGHGIGIYVGGNTHVLPVRVWHALPCIVETAIKWLSSASSADGSGHVDLARALRRMLAEAEQKGAGDE